MTEFYATGVKQIVTQELNEKGKMEKSSRTSSVVIDLTHINSHAFAQSEAIRIAKKEGITLDGYGVRVVQGTQKGGSTMTKYAKQRKRLRGLEQKKRKNKIN